MTGWRRTSTLAVMPPTVTAATCWTLRLDYWDIGAGEKLRLLTVCDYDKTVKMAALLLWFMDDGNRTKV